MLHVCVQNTVGLEELHCEIWYSF